MTFLFVITNQGEKEVADKARYEELKRMEEVSDIYKCTAYD